MPPDIWNHPAFAALTALFDPAALDRASGTPALQRLMETVPWPVVNASGRRLRLVESGAVAAADYERSVDGEGVLKVHAASWHDRFNACAWGLFPRTKAAISARHARELEQAGAGANGRTRVRDALTVFDEDGIVVAAADPLVEDAIRNFQWTRLFVESRAVSRAKMLCVPIGHALMEKLLDPFVGLTANAVFVPVDDAFFGLPWNEKLRHLDERCVARVDELVTPRDLSPLPVLGIPGWWAANERHDFYDNREYFRSGRRGVR